MPSDKRSLSVLSTLVLLHGLPPLDLSLKHPLTEKLRQNCLNINDRQYFPNDMTMLHNLPDLVVELGVADLSALQFACDLKSLFFISCQDAITTVITTIIITVTNILHHYPSPLSITIIRHHYHPDRVDQVALASDVSLRLCKGFTLLLLPARDNSREI